jgi:hypothetical protein
MQSKNNSQVAKSLVKIALEKGLITQEKYKSVKEAAAKLTTNLTPTDNLSENIVKLCNGLRTQGFSKYADEVEKKFVQYKKAQALYDVSGETGENLVDRAHPDGSHKMEGVEGDSVIETILDRQKKIQQAISKAPTGKLAAKDAINIARIILGQAQQNVEQLKETVSQNLNAYSSLYRQIKQITDKELTAFNMRYLDATFVSDPTYNKIKAEYDYITFLLNSMKPSGVLGRVFTNPWGIGEVSEHTWGIVGGALGNSLRYLEAALEAQDKIDNAKESTLEQASSTTQPVQQTSVDPLLTKINDLTNRVAKSDKITPQQKKEFADWLNKKEDAITPQTYAEIKRQVDQAEQTLQAKGIV